MSVFDKVSSFDMLFKSAIAAFARFPFTLLSAILGTAISILMVEMSSSDSGLPQRLLMAAALGLPLFTALVLFGEKRNLNQSKILALQGAGAVLLVGYFFTLPSDVTFESIHAIRFMLLNIGLHFLVAILPYFGGDETRGFWQYNKSLFLRFLTAALYSAVMYIGLTIALASADQLFGIDVDRDRYFELWIIITGLFNTWIFLAGVPANLAELETLDDYPKGLKVFTQYILLPLVALYLFILYAYEAKIIVTWNWPIGWVSNLILWYSVVGIFSLLLLHPLKERAENKWIAVFSKWFFRALIPLVVLLFLAILRRISDYGVTENRYIVMAMAIGLSIVVLYFVISKVRDIRIIPIVICCIAFLSAFGPWGAFSVSLKSQQNRLESMLIENNLLSDGVIQKTSEDIPLEARKEMSSIVNYLVNWHGIESFSTWIDTDSLESTDSWSSVTITSALGFDNVYRWQDSATEETFSINVSSTEPLSITGYDYLVRFNFNRGNGYGLISDTLSFEFDGKIAKIWPSEGLNGLILQLGDSNRTDNIAKFAIAKQMKVLRDSTNQGDEITNDLVTFSASASDFEARIILINMGARETAKGVELRYINAKLLIRIH